MYVEVFCITGIAMGLWNKWKSGLLCSVFHQNLQNARVNQNHCNNSVRVKSLTVLCSVEQRYQRHKMLIQQTVTVPCAHRFHELLMDRETASHPHSYSEIYACQKYWFYFPDCTNTTSVANRHVWQISFAKANKGEGSIWTYSGNDNWIFFQDGILQQNLGKCFCALTS